MGRNELETKLSQLRTEQKNMPRFFLIGLVFVILWLIAYFVFNSRILGAFMVFPILSVAFGVYTAELRMLKRS